ncbi:AzlC family ABC transporter permease [Pseudooceanicola sp. 502str34]|uniref:AzlC family ABC transporter permease n=1 Tax=Maritimibacter alkaliphilus TaxID=404236 RepID=UPI001C93AB5A|nr:AzlC family ABC transporter permease [Maritimibacter alkaliphilus]MBY6092424.1 AzlC family ABC transporter permease [Maritimibacter alkaliphilus]
MSSISKSAFWLGLRDGAPFALVVGPFAMLFGVVAADAGLNALEATAVSLAVIAGAAQFTAIGLLADHAPTFVALASALAVNLRMAMYSASLTPHLGAAPLWQRALAAYLTVDQSYALAMVTYPKHPDWGTPQKMGYFLGTVTAICPFWYLLTIVGALVGNRIPPEFALDFALPITFLAMVAPMLKTRAHLAAALVAILLSLLLAWMPYNLGLMVAAIAGMMAGARVEVMTGGAK